MTYAVFIDLVFLFDAVSQNTTGSCHGNVTYYSKWLGINMQSSGLSHGQQRHTVLKRTCKVIAVIFTAGLALLLGFWLMLASNMGPAYLPLLCNGCLDSWVRILLLGAGIGIWTITAIWLLWVMLRYGYTFIKHRD